jgi:hypothetical protein
MANPPDVDVRLGRIEPPRRNPPQEQPWRNPADTARAGTASMPPPRVATEDRRIVEVPLPGQPALPEADRVDEAIDLVGRYVGRAIGYVRTRTPAQMRADAERVVVENPVLSLAAALGFGYLVGRQVRR